MRDYLQRDIAIGDYVIGMQSNVSVPEVYVVEKFNPKTLKLREINTGDTKSKKSHEVILLSDEEVEYYTSRPIVDALGNKLEEGDVVVSGDGEYVDLYAWRVTEVYTTKVEVEAINKSWRCSQVRYGHDFVKVPAELVTFAMLKEE